MKPHGLLSGILGLTVATSTLLAGGAPAFRDFVKRSGDTLTEDGAVYRFIGTNMPDVLQIISHTPFGQDFDSARYRLPDEYEIRDAVRTERQLGGRVMRAFVITCRNHYDPSFMFDVSSLPVKANEQALRVIDKMLQVCNEEGIRVYLPLVAANSQIRGDTTTYGPDFWKVGSSANLRFKDMVRQLLERTNAYTGVKYKDDRAILAWESGNELVIGTDPLRRTWLHDMAAYVKAIDPNHLYMDGRDDPNGIYGIYDEFLDDPNIDLLSYHTYHKLKGHESPVDALKAMRAYIAHRKPLVVGEIAMFTPPDVLRNLLNEIISDGTVGANFWAQRFRSRDGGFYRHSDRGSMFEDLNWPGFAAMSRDLDAEARTEVLLQDILCDAAYRIQGLPRAPIPRPAPPVLLPIADRGHIAWQGSTGASGYDIERAASSSGPWATLVRALPDNANATKAAFADESLGDGTPAWYRVIASNPSGRSDPSNAVGPVPTDLRWLVDKCLDLTRLDSRSYGLKIQTHHARDSYLEDKSLLCAAHPGEAARAVYRVDGVIRQVTLNVYHCGDALELSVSENGKAFSPLPPSVTPFDHDTRAQLRASAAGGRWRFLQVELKPDASPKAAIGQVEIVYDPGGRAP